MGLKGAMHTHLKSVQSKPDKMICYAISDNNKDVLSRETAILPGVFAYNDYREMLKLPELDAVIIATPHDTHKRICVDCLNAGKHVLIEKPLAPSVSECREICAAAEKSGKVLAVGHNERFIPGYAKIKEILDSGELGRIFGARADHYQNFNPREGSWWKSKDKIGGGCVMGSGIHRLDLLRWYIGEVADVKSHSVGVPFRFDGEVLNASVLTFENGAIAEFFCNWGVYRYPVFETLSIFGEEGMVCFDGEKLLKSTRACPELTPVDPGFCPDLIGHFYDCIVTGKKPLVDGYEGTKAVEMVEKIYDAVDR
ncbi:MAG TPA: Gfo/Idh/MocA family oxidoreductase [Oscillospiraceae bacterium]|nr:Gfo/Idh/MocA family oxidoreductase [Oscillospiraceae bacterium]